MMHIIGVDNQGLKSKSRSTEKHANILDLNLLTFNFQCKNLSIYQLNVQYILELYFVHEKTDTLMVHPQRL